MLKNDTFGIYTLPETSKTVPLLAIISVMLGAALCAWADMEFEACILIFGYLTTELASWPVA